MPKTDIQFLEDRLSMMETEGWRDLIQDLENLEGQNKTNAGEYIGGASFFVSFSDVISVLLCFFVVFFAIGELDALKFNKLLSTFSGDEIRPDIFNARVSNDEFDMLESNIAQLYS